MRLLVFLPLIAFTALLVPLGHFTASDAVCPGQGAAASNASGLILQQSEGERRVRRPRPGGGATMAAPSMIIKVDGRNGASPDFFVGYEEIAPGSAIPAHAHPEYDEVLFVHQGKGLATLGSQQRVVTAGATIYIPPKTRVSLKNTGTQTLSVFFIFPRPEMVADYYREMTVVEGERAVPFSAEEFAAFRARHRGHIIFDAR
jgi:mannose-6-phosphate isomerase-like protein (cupin superfamily)